MSESFEVEVSALCQRYLDDHRLMEAMVVAKKLVKAEPNNANAHFLLARVFIAKRDRARAGECLARGLEIEPRSSEGHRVASMVEQLPSMGRATRMALWFSSREIMLAPFILVPLLVSIAVLWFQCGQ